MAGRQGAVIWPTQPEPEPCRDYEDGTCLRGARCHRYHDPNLTATSPPPGEDFTLPDLNGCQRCMELGRECDKAKRPADDDPCAECRWSLGDRGTCKLIRKNYNDTLWEKMLGNRSTHYTLGVEPSRDIGGGRRPAEPMPAHRVKADWVGESMEELSKKAPYLLSYVREHPARYLTRPVTHPGEISFRRQRAAQHRELETKRNNTANVRHNTENWRRREAEPAASTATPPAPMSYAPTETPSAPVPMPYSQYPRLPGPGYKRPPGVRSQNWVWTDESHGHWVLTCENGDVIRQAGLAVDESAPPTMTALHHLPLRQRGGYTQQLAALSQVVGPTASMPLAEKVDSPSSTSFEEQPPRKVVKTQAETPTNVKTDSDGTEPDGGVGVAA